MWFIGVEVEQETSAPPPKKNPGSAPDTHAQLTRLYTLWHWNEERSVEIRYTRLPGP